MTVCLLAFSSSGSEPANQGIVTCSIAVVSSIYSFPWEGLLTKPFNRFLPQHSLESKSGVRHGCLAA
jgi:hypothetical protein